MLEEIDAASKAIATLLLGAVPEKWRWDDEVGWHRALFEYNREERRLSKDDQLKKLMAMMVATNPNFRPCSVDKDTQAHMTRFLETPEWFCPPEQVPADVQEMLKNLPPPSPGMQRQIYFTVLK